MIRDIYKMVDEFIQAGNHEKDFIFTERFVRCLANDLGGHSAFATIDELHDAKLTAQVLYTGDIGLGKHMAWENNCDCIGALLFGNRVILKFGGKAKSVALELWWQATLYKKEGRINRDEFENYLAHYGAILRQKRILEAERATNNQDDSDEPEHYDETFEAGEEEEYYDDDYNSEVKLIEEEFAISQEEYAKNEDEGWPD